MSRCLRVLLTIFAIVTLLGALAFINLGRWLQGPEGTPSRADVVVLLGGDSRARLAKALDLYRQGLAPKVFLAGSDNDRLPPGHTLPNARLQFLVEEGVPRSAILLDDMSFNSWEEASNTLALMRRSGWHTALVISDPPHMRRLSWIWRRTFDGTDRSYTLIASNPKWWDPGEWWRDEWSAQFVLMEVIKMGYYYAVR